MEPFSACCSAITLVLNLPLCAHGESLWALRPLPAAACAAQHLTTSSWTLPASRLSVRKDMGNSYHHISANKLTPLDESYCKN